MSMSVQKSQVHKTATRSQDDDKRLCLVDDLKEVQVHIQVKPIKTSLSLKSKITTSCSQDEAVNQYVNQQEERQTALLTRRKREGLSWMTRNERPKVGHMQSTKMGVAKINTTVKSYVVRKKKGNNHADRPSLSNILNTSVMIHSNTIIRRDGKVQSFCGLKLSDIGSVQKRETKKAFKLAALASATRIDHSINVERCLYTFCINRQTYHRIGSLLPKEGTQPSGRHNSWEPDPNVRSEQFHRQGISNGKGLVSFAYFYECGVTSAFKRKNSRQYNAIIVAEVAALITNDFGDGEPTRDIVVNQKDSGPKRILELHSSYIALQYPLLFGYGEDGYHDKIPYHSNTRTRKTNRGYVIMKEYYAYEIQYRKEHGTMTVLSCSVPDRWEFLGLKYGRYGVSKVLDTAYWGFFRVGTTFDVFQNILFPYSLNMAYCLLLDTAYWILFPSWSLVRIYQKSQENSQARTRESEEFKAEARKAKLQSKSVKDGQ
ncbi:hypothetical protein Tco_1384289 [Tanacetum coccineum]